MSAVLSTVKTLAIGTAGGALFSLFGIPMAWMLGALAACMLATQFIENVYVPSFFRELLQPILGVMLGSFFTSSLMDELARWPMVLVFLLTYVFVASLFGVFYFRRIAGYNLPTAFFSAVPGGLSDLTVVGESLGANIVVLGLTHSIRVLMVVVLTPLIVAYFASGPVATVAATRPDMIGFTDTGILILCGVIGYAFGRLTRMPAGATLGPLLVSAAAHLADLTAGAPPQTVIFIVQIVLGSYIGARFVDLEWHEFRSALVHGIIWSSGLIAIATLAAIVCAWETGFGLPQLLLAFAPGGLAEMGLLTLALGIDVALVTTCHAARIILIYLVIPVAARGAGKRSAKIKDTGFTDD